MKTLIVLLGPTAVGKTSLSIRLAKKFGSPIISADSRQMFKELKIGTAKPSEKEMDGITHYFISSISIHDYYSAAMYETEGIALIEELFNNHDTLILTGGSMMYIDAICHGIDDIPTVDDDTRKAVMDHYNKDGLATLSKELMLIDPNYARTADLKNPKRVMHALEIYYMTGKTYSSFRTSCNKKRPFKILYIGLERERDLLYNRINARVDQMIADGLVDEAKSLAGYSHLNALNTVGYKELFAHFRGECSLQEAIDKIKQNTRIYSRKQMTWFRKNKDINWFNADETDSIESFIHSHVAN